jgi:hypothetical protein
MKNIHDFTFFWKFCWNDHQLERSSLLASNLDSNLQKNTHIYNIYSSYKF